MITLEANYSKKIGLPGFSSHQFCVSLKTELADASQVQAESSKLYDEWPELRQLSSPDWMRAERALREIAQRGAASSLHEEDCLAALQYVAGDPALNIIIETCLKHQVTPEDLLGEMQAYEAGF